LQLADYLLEIIPAVAVQNQKLVNSLPIKGGRDVAKHHGLRARIHVDAQWDVELTGVYSERNRRQRHHPRSLGGGQPG